ncbi:MAG: nitroreductase family protein [Spirochaetota bacterium]|nr:MAG: nitroreductase family protein [Spirochaetota bacterium]
MVDSNILKKLLNAGIWAPTAGNIQPWIFVCVTGEDMIHKIGSICI